MNNKLDEFLVHLAEGVSSKNVDASVAKIFEKVHKTGTENAELANGIMEFSESLKSFIDMCNTGKNDKEDIITSTFNALTLFLMFLQHNGLIDIYSQEKLLAKEIFGSFNINPKTDGKKKK